MMFLHLAACVCMTLLGCILSDAGLQEMRGHQALQHAPDVKVSQAGKVQGGMDHFCMVQIWIITAAQLLCLLDLF